MCRSLLSFESASYLSVNFIDLLCARIHCISHPFLFIAQFSDQRHQRGDRSSECILFIIDWNKRSSRSTWLSLSIMRVMAYRPLRSILYGLDHANRRRQDPSHFSVTPVASYAVTETTAILLMVDVMAAPKLPTVVGAEPSIERNDGIRSA